jgi:hypothetical protein
MKSTCPLLARIALAVAFMFAALPTTHAHERIGANVNNIRDFGRNHEFSDLVKQSRKFLRIGQFDDENAANLAPIGTDGWPTGDFRLLAMAAQQGTQGLAGTYRIIFNGQANLAVGGGGAGSIANKTFDGATNTTRADLIFPAGAENMIIDFSATSGTVKNLRVLRPGVDVDNPPLLTSAFVAHMRRFNVLRYMDWSRTNGNRDVTWADRVTPEKLRTEQYTAQWETIIDAANLLNRDAWINIPVRANDEYVTNLATLVRDRLASHLNVYVEYGNELWNFSIRDDALDRINGNSFFNQATINRDLAVAEAAANAGSPLRFDGTSDASTLAFRRVGLRLKQISDIFRTVWGAGAINTRVRPVLAGQMANSFIVSEGLRVVDEGLNVRPSTVFYAISGAPYIFAEANVQSGNAADADEVAGLTLEQLISKLQQAVAGAPSDSTGYQYTNHAALGAWYGLKVNAYEMGFDSFGANNIAVKRQANLDPRIRTIMCDLINQWHAFGFDHPMWFVAGAGSYDTQFGMWPLVEDMTQQATPKNQCIDDIAAASLPAITAGASVAGPIAGGAFRGSTNPTGTVTGSAGPFGFPGFVEYLLRADSEGTYNLSFRGSAPSGEGIRVKLNNATVSNNVTLPATTGTSATLAVNLRRGLNALRLERIGGSWIVESFTFTLTGDATPDAFSFAPVSAVTTGSTVTSAAATISGITTAAAVTVLGGSYSIGCTGTFVTTPGTISNNQTVCLRHTASGQPASSVTTTLTIGGITGTFTSTTAGAVATFTLNVNKAGTGSGTVTSSPAGISCGNTCSAGFPAGTAVTLSPVAAGGSVFAGWSGACSGTAACTLSLDAARSVTATFNSTCDTGVASADCDGDGIPNSVEATEGRNPLVKDNDVFSSSRLFVMQQFRDFLAREGDVGGINFWKGEIDAGRQSRASMAENFLNSPEYRNLISPITRLYFASFIRIPDFDGLRFWIGEFSSGRRSYDNIANFFAESPEFLATYGALNNAQFVDRVYLNVLDRSSSADPGGFNFWLGELNGGRRSRGQVLGGFSESAEYQTNKANEIFLVSLYVAMLQRAPTTAELNADKALLLSGTSQRTLIQRTIDGAEYRRRFLP